MPQLAPPCCLRDVSEVGRLIVESEQVLPEQERRGRMFLSVYATFLVLATLFFVLLALFVRDQDMIARFDGPVARAIQAIDWGPAPWVLTHVSDLGWFPYDTLSVVVVAVTLFVLRLRIESAVVVASTILAGETGSLVKELVQRSRPAGNIVHLTAHLTGYSFPSGHVIFATVLFGTTFCVVWMAWRDSPIRDLVLAALLVPVLLMGPSRIYLGEHWPSDVLGAYCFAGLWVAAAMEIILVLKPRLTRSWQGRPHRRRWKPLL